MPSDAEFETFEEKSKRNARVQVRYDELIREGKHGHYETLFRIVREEYERMTGVPPWSVLVLSSRPPDDRSQRHRRASV